MLVAKQLKYHAFGSSDPIDELGPTNQRNYVRRYLSELGACSIVEEPQYFDRNYLDEFAAFYGASARGYSNACRRLHIFAGTPFDRHRLEEFVSGDDAARHRAQTDYLGFIVVRPLDPPLFGRTVLRWYPDHPKPDEGPRETNASRDYVVHLAGVPLTVRGLGWQQQDGCVSSCATVALWSMLQSSAFDDHHAIPTTADIARTVHRSSPHRRVAPSGGLRKDQLVELIFAHDLSPIVVGADKLTEKGRGFTPERFATSCAALLRSGYPVLVSGTLARRGGHSGGHAMCITGFRIEHGRVARPSGRYFDSPDASVGYVYVHDDNLGPNVRYQVRESGGLVRLRPEAPATSYGTSKYSGPLDGKGQFTPNSLLVAVHASLRTSPDALLRAGIELAQPFAALAHGPNAAADGVALSTRFVGLRAYLGHELPRLLGAEHPQALARARLGLTEDVPPLSLHLGLVRLGDGTRPLVDILYDTTDRDRALRPCAHVVFDDRAARILNALAKADRSLGVQIDASTPPAPRAV